MKTGLSLRQSMHFTWLNLRRHTRRTVITAGAVAVGLMLYIIIDSMLLGLEQESNRNIIWYETGAAQVVNEDYLAERDLRPLTSTLDDPEEIIARLEEVGLSSTIRTVFSGEMIVFYDPYPEDGSVNITAYGIDPLRDENVFRLKQNIEEGDYIQAGTSQALIGAWLAEDLEAEVGYPFTIVTRTREGFYQTIDLEIAGILRTPNPIINRNCIFLPLDVADDYLQMGAHATEVAVASPPGSSLDELTGVMRTALAGISCIETVSWKQLASDAVAIAEAKQSGTGLILLLVFVIAAVGISNTILMSILERTRELGMMRAIGMRDGEVMRILLLEAAGIGLMGGLIGIVLGAAGTLFMVNIGIDYSFLLRDVNIGYRFAGQLYGAWNPAAFVQALAAGIIISVMTALIPVRRALKMPVIDALRNGKGVV